MDLLDAKSGFRVRTEIYFRDEIVPKKYFIYLNKGEWFQVSDVMNHIKKIFQLKNNIEIYIDDLILPKNETIDLIQKEDMLIVKVLPFENQNNEESNDCSKLQLPDFSLGELKKQNKKTKKRGSNRNLTTSLNSELEYLRELELKKIEILNSDVIFGSSPIIEVNGNVTDENLTDDLLPPKKKRKRKHKKKTKPEDNLIFDENIETDTKTNTDKIPSNRNISASHSPKENHIYFSEVVDDSLPIGSTEKVQKSISEDIQLQLAKIASRPIAERIFMRKTESSDMLNSTETNKIHENDVNFSSHNPKKLSSQNSNEPSFAIVKTPIVGDTITFTKIKIGENYCPQPSGEIIGKILKVKSVKDDPNDFCVLMDIIEGKEEFQLPEGKFSLDQEEEFPINAGKIFYAELFWHEVLEPHSQQQIEPSITS